MGEVDADRQLRHLGGLEGADAGNHQPAPRAERLGADSIEKEIAKQGKLTDELRRQLRVGRLHQHRTVTEDDRGDDVFALVHPLDQGEAVGSADLHQHPTEVGGRRDQKQGAERVS